jgi:AraC-like DNA-binding protein
MYDPASDTRDSMADIADSMNFPARQLTHGFTWPDHGDLRPALVSAMQFVFTRREPTQTFRHEHWVLDYNFDPHGRVRVGDGPRARWFDRAEPTAHLYAPRVAYREDRRTARPPLVSAYLIVAGGEKARLDDLLAPMGFARFLDPTGRLGRMIREIAALGYASRERGRWRAQALMFETIDLLHAAQRVDEFTWRIVDPRESDERAAHDELPLAMRVESYLASHLTKPVSLRELADHLDISESSLSHRYSADTGATPIATLLRMRVDMAKGMLLKGHPLKLIAQQTGFADAFHLSRTFKRLAGCTASEYRRGSSARRR